LLQLRSEPPLLGADPEFTLAVTRQRQLLLLFYQASLNAMAGHRTQWAQDMQRLLEGDDENLYYRWFGAGSL
jgi:spermidine synthase